MFDKRGKGFVLSQRDCPLADSCPTAWSPDSHVVVWVGAVRDVECNLLTIRMRPRYLQEGRTDHSDADIASSSGRPAQNEDEVLTKLLRYEYGFKKPEGADPFFREYAVNPSTRIMRAGHGGWLSIG